MTTPLTDADEAKRLNRTTFVTNRRTRSANHVTLLDRYADTVFAQVGPQGPQGDPGPQGAKGDKGDQGDRGPAGNDGARGPQGNTGPAGANGADGTNGTNGTNGWSIRVTPESYNNGIIQRVTWVGGTGTPPAGNGQYLTSIPGSFTSDRNQATNFRGPQGPAGTGGGGSGTAGRNGQFERPIYFTKAIGPTRPATPNVTNPTINSSGNVTFGTITSGWANTYPETSPNFSTETLWEVKVGLRWSADNTSISVQYITQAHPISPVATGGGGGQTPQPGDPVEGAWQSTDSDSSPGAGPFHTIMNFRESEPIDVTMTVATDNDGLRIRIPMAQTLRIERQVIGGTGHEDDTANWTVTTDATYRYYAKGNFRSGVSPIYRLTVT